MSRKIRYYDINNEVFVASDVALPELARFRVQRLTSEPTVRVRIPERGAPWAAPDSERAAPAGGRRVQYHDGLGRMGFGMEIMYGQTGETIQVLASPLLARSPHVLYTNVLEPVLRWTFVEKGYALVHGACVAVDDRAYLITARTDTGKTTTILRLLDNYRGISFLSDDLTLVQPDGTVLSYPKPLTISLHTMVAVNSPLLTRRERLTLPLQSRLHSKSGRMFGMLLAKTRIPMATMNAIVQMLVPPPKYHVERLVPHVTTPSNNPRLAGMFIIERGEDGVQTLSDTDAIEILLENCEDAYGFPPYPEIKHLLYQTSERDLRPLERNVVATALSGLPAVLLRSSTRDWWRELPAHMGISAPLSRSAIHLAEPGQSEQLSDLRGTLAPEPAQLSGD